MSTKFFTNEAGRTLIEKIEGVFQHKKIHFLDVLVGYFRASGYFRVRPFVQKSGKIRILVGINIDRLVQEAWDKGLQFGANPATSRTQFLAALTSDIQQSAYDRFVEEGMIGLVDDIAAEKVEIRIHPSQTIHAKVYIFREETKHAHGYGAVSQIYSDEENPESFGLFEKTVKEDVDERLALLMELRAFKNAPPDRFKQIKNLPQRARTGRAQPALAQSTLAFIRSHRRDAFIHARADATHEELTFVEAARRFRAEPAEKSLPLHDQHHAQVQAAIGLFHEMLQEDLAREQKVDPKLGPNEKKALQLLSALRQMPVSSEKEQALLESAQNAIRVGKFQQLHRDLNKLQKAVAATPVAPSLLLERVVAILGKYPIAPDAEVSSSPTRASEPAPPTAARLPEIIISESFV